MFVLTYILSDRKFVTTVLSDKIDHIIVFQKVCSLSWKHCIMCKSYYKKLLYLTYLELKWYILFHLIHVMCCRLHILPLAVKGLARVIEGMWSFLRGFGKMTRDETISSC